VAKVRLGKWITGKSEAAKADRKSLKL